MVVSPFVHEADRYAQLWQYVCVAYRRLNDRQKIDNYSPGVTQ